MPASDGGAVNWRRVVDRLTTLATLAASFAALWVALHTDRTGESQLTLAEAEALPVVTVTSQDRGAVYVHVTGVFTSATVREVALINLQPVALLAFTGRPEPRYPMAQLEDESWFGLRTTSTQTSSSALTVEIPEPEWGRFTQLSASLEAPERVGWFATGVTRYFDVSYFDRFGKLQHAYRELDYALSANSGTPEDGTSQVISASDVERLFPSVAPETAISVPEPPPQPPPPVPPPPASSFRQYRPVGETRRNFGVLVGLEHETPATLRAAWRQVTAPLPEARRPFWARPPYAPEARNATTGRA